MKNIASNATNFEAAVEASRSLPSQSNENLLKLYSLYKQATLGDVSGKKPGLLDVRGRAKFKAWSDLAGMKKEEAKLLYIELVQSLSEQAATI